MRAVAWYLLIASLALCGTVLLCCAGPGKAAAEASFTAEHLACVDKAKTREESRVCRALVDLRWGIDGGRDAAE